MRGIRVMPDYHQACPNVAGTRYVVSPRTRLTSEAALG